MKKQQIFQFLIVCFSVPMLNVLLVKSVKIICLNKLFHCSYDASLVFSHLNCVVIRFMMVTRNWLKFISCLKFTSSVEEIISTNKNSSYAGHGGSSAVDNSVLGNTRNSLPVNPS